MDSEAVISVKSIKRRDRKKMRAFICKHYQLYLMLLPGFVLLFTYH